MRKLFFAVFYAPDGAPSGAPAATLEPSSSPAPAPAPSGAPSGAGTPPATATPGGPAAPTFNFPEDRKDWIPPYRYNQAAERARQLEVALETERQRVRALAGFGDEGRGGRPRFSPEEQRVAEAIGKLLPGSELLARPELQQLVELMQSGQLQEALGLVGSYWGRHAQSYGRQLVDTYAKAIGADPKSLPPNAMRRLAGVFQQYIAEDRTGERTSRYENEDPALLSEFAAELTGIFIEPVRRSATTAAATTVETNRRLPQQGPRGGIPPGEPPKKLRGQDLRTAARDFVRKQTGQA
jgi:hypothetical protein